jgi:hypothetical protein
VRAQHVHDLLGVEGDPVEDLARGREERRLVVVPRDDADRPDAEGAGLVAVPLGEDVPQQARLGRAFDLAEALLAAVALLGPARAGLEAQHRAAGARGHRGVPGVDLDRDHLAVLRADDDPGATVAQPDRDEPPAEEQEHADPDENGDADKELNGHGRPPRSGFNSRSSRRE